jgi:RHS repeat-associated protein
VIDALQNETEFTYDDGNRLLSVQYPGGSTASFTYDYRGRRETVTDQNGKTTRYVYDDADRLTSVTDAESHVTKYAYDTESNPLSVTDANNRATSFEYDAYGRVMKTIYPSTLSESYAYDAIGNLASRTDRKGQTIEYVYDALDRLKQKKYPDTTHVDLIYDLLGRLKQVNDSTGTYGFAYDNLGRTTSATTEYSFLPGNPFTNTYAYDSASKRIGFTAPDGSQTAYSYDTLNQLSTLTNSWAGTFGFQHDELGRRTKLTRPNGISTGYSYNNLSHLLSVLHKAGETTVDGTSYVVDPTGNRTSKTDLPTGATSNYAYDKIYQLLNVQQGGNKTEEYTHDTVGNILSALNLGTQTYNTSNQLTSTSIGSYTYDNNGNTLTDANSRSYTWDYDNRLSQAVVPGTGTVTFKYDPFGRRIQKSSPNGTTNYVYDGSDITAEYGETGILKAKYAQGPGIDQPLAQFRSNTLGFYHADGLGSITSLTDSNGAILNTYAYDAFGNQTSTTESVGNPFRYTAREFDTETGLYYYRARYYDPQARRFISEDPIGLNGGINLYAYVGNNPLYLRDPLGLDPYAGYANGYANPSNDINAFKERAIQGAGSNAFPFNSPGSLAKALKEAHDITRLDLHGHGTIDAFFTGDPMLRIYPDHFYRLAKMIADGRIDVEKGASIHLFACHQDYNAKEFSKFLADLGRGDITVTGASGSVYPNKNETKAFVSGGMFITYKNGVPIVSAKSLSYSGK